MSKSPEMPQNPPESVVTNERSCSGRVVIGATAVTASVLLGSGYLNQYAAQVLTDPQTIQYMERASTLLTSAAVLEATAGLLFAKAIATKHQQRRRSAN